MQESQPAPTASKGLNKGGYDNESSIGDISSLVGVQGHKFFSDLSLITPSSPSICSGRESEEEDAEDEVNVANDAGRRTATSSGLANDDNDKDKDNNVGGGGGGGGGGGVG
jgi:hypothetical protein